MWRPAVAGCFDDHRAVVVGFGVLLDEDGVGTGRHRRAGEDAHGLARPDGAVVAVAGGGHADDLQGGRHVGGIGGAHGVAVHRGGIEGRLGAPRLERLGQRAAGGLGQRHILGTTPGRRRR